MSALSPVRHRAYRSVPAYRRNLRESAEPSHAPPGRTGQVRRARPRTGRSHPGRHRSIRLQEAMHETTDRKSVESGKSVSVRVHLGGRRIIKKKTTHHNQTYIYSTQQHTQPDLTPTCYST